MTAALAAEAALLPSEFVATTVNVHELPEREREQSASGEMASQSGSQRSSPFTRPDTVMGLPAPLPVAPPGLAVTVKPVTASPPSKAGVNDTTTWPLPPRVPETAVGALGTVAGVAAAEAALLVPVPTALMAATTNVKG